MLGWFGAAALGYASPSLPATSWIEGRWRVASETVEGTAPLILGFGGRELVTPAWQIEAVLVCEREPLREQMVSCRVEAAALRAATFDHWQRSADRRIVADLLGRVRDQLLVNTIWLEVAEPGAVRIASESSASPLASTLLGQVLHGFHLTPPPGGWRVGVRWETGSEPLLHLLHAVPASSDDRGAAHGVTDDEGAWVVQTIAATATRAWLAERGRYAYRRTDWRTSEAPPGVAQASFDVPSVPLSLDMASFEGKFTLRAEARLEAGRLQSRKWSMTGLGATQLLKSGFVRRIADDAAVRLGPTQQISAPGEPRPGIAGFVPVLEQAP